VNLDITGEIWFWRGPSPQEGGYIVPMKDVVRKAEQVGLGDVVTVRLTVDV
jgi:hypothetical protein